MEKQTKVKSMKSETVREFIERKRKEASEEFELPSGLMCQLSYFSARDAQISQKMAQSSGGDLSEEMLMNSMIASSCSFNGEKLTAEEISMLPGMDFMVLQGKLAGVS